MKYKYEFEVEEYFEPGYCRECPLSYVEWDEPWDVHCVLYVDDGECPLEKVE